MVSVPGTSGAGPWGGTNDGNCSLPEAAGRVVAPAAVVGAADDVLPAGAGADVAPAGALVVAGAVDVHAARMPTPIVASAARPLRRTNVRREKLSATANPGERRAPPRLFVIKS